MIKTVTSELGGDGGFTTKLEMERNGEADAPTRSTEPVDVPTEDDEPDDDSPDPPEEETPGNDGWSGGDNSDDGDW